MGIWIDDPFGSAQDRFSIVYCVVESPPEADLGLASTSAMLLFRPKHRFCVRSPAINRLSVSIFFIIFLDKYVQTR